MHRTTFLLIIVLLLFPEISTARNIYPPRCAGDDTLDPYPAWACVDLHDEIRAHLRWEGWESLDIHSRQRLIDGESILHIEPFLLFYGFPRTTNETIRLLAWRSVRQRRPIVPSNNGDSLAGERMRHQALVAVSFLDDAFVRKWVVMEVTLTEKEDGERRWCIPDLTVMLGRNRSLKHITEISGCMSRTVMAVGKIIYWFDMESPESTSTGSLGSVTVGSDLILKRDARSPLTAIERMYRDFDAGKNSCYDDIDPALFWYISEKSPTNISMYSFLTELSTHRGEAGDAIGFFDPQWFVNPEFEVFIDGDVRENTWKSVIGEAPTLFFPNGK